MSPNPRSGKLQLQSSLHSEFSYTCTATYHCHPEQLAATLPDTPRLWLLSFRHCHSTMGSLHWCWCIENICTCNRTPGSSSLHTQVIIATLHPEDTVICYRDVLYISGQWKVSVKDFRVFLNPRGDHLPLHHHTSNNGDWDMSRSCQNLISYIPPFSFALSIAYVPPSDSQQQVFYISQWPWYERHASSLTTLPASLHDFSIFICLSLFLHAKLLLRCELRTISGVALVRQLPLFPRLAREIRKGWKKEGAPCEDRTHDLQIMRLTRCLLR